MTEKEFVEKLRICPFTDEYCIYYDRCFNKCNRLAIMDPEMFMLNYCIKCKEE